MENEEKGILVDRQIQADIQKYNKHFHEMVLLAVKYAYLLLASFGIARGFLHTFQIPADGVLLAVGIVIICAVYTAIYSFPGKIKFTLPALIAVTVLLCVVMQKPLAAGLGNIFNRMAEQVNSYYELTVPLAATDAVSPAGQMVSVYLILMIFIGIMASGMIYYLDARVTALVMTFPLALSLAVGLFPDMLSALMMLAALTGTFFLQYTRQREGIHHNVITVHMGSGLLSSLRWQIAAAAAAVMLLLIPVSYFSLGPMINEGYESQSELREDIRSGEIIDSMRNFWKKLIRGEWDWLPFDIIRSSGVHGGKLSNIKEIRDYDELHLYLDISDDLNAPLYIRGYVGSNYTGKGWKEQTKEQQREAEAAGMSASELSGRYFRLLESLQANGSPGVYGMLRFVITNRDANSAYSYIPYGCDFSDFAPSSDAFDVYPEEKTDESILNLYYMNTQKLSNLEALEEAGAGNSGDEAYRQYVRETYLDVPTEGLDQFYQEYGGLSFDSAADCVDFVRSSLNGHAEYTKTPGSTPKGKDYVEYFLYENRQGVCTHFATAAVLMFRTFGIPARYVEGYLTMNLTAGSGPNEIMDECAHAWAEIYIDGAGWVPIEVTPGFINEADMQDDREPSTLEEDRVQDVENSSEDPADVTSEEETTQEQEATVIGEFQTEEETTAPTVPTQPSPPTQPTEPTQPSAQQPDDGSDSLLRSILQIVMIIAAVVVILALLLLLARLQYKKRLALLEARLHGEPRRAILTALDLIERISEEEGLRLDENTELKKVQEVYPFMDADTIRWLQSISLEAVYSRHSFDADVRQDVVGIYRDFAAQIMEKSSPVKRLVMRYIRCYI